MNRDGNSDLFIGKRIVCQCGHTIRMYEQQFNRKNKINEQYIICRWCGQRIYFDKKSEFKQTLLQKIRKDKNDKC